jgi:hypothetical protein
VRNLPTLTHPRTKLGSRFMKFKQVTRSHQFVMGWGVVFGEVIGEIVFTGAPVNDELVLLDSIADPVESHVNCFGSALFDCFVDNASGTSIVGLDWCGCLWMAHFC